MLRRILVVDDDADTREVVAAIFAEEGVHPVCVSSAAEAIEATQHFTPCLILADNRMPDVLGEDLLTQLRSNPRLSNLPMVLMTGDRVAAEALAKRGIRVLAKPFSIDDVLALARTCR